MSVILSCWLRPMHIQNLLFNRSWSMVNYEDESVVTWYGNMVEPFLELEEAMGSDDGKTSTTTVI